MIIYFTQDGNTALDIACKEGHINVIQCSLSQGADMTIKKISSKTPLDERCDTSEDEIFSLFSKYNPKRGEVNKNYIALLIVLFLI